MTRSERYNARMHAIFERARELEAEKARLTTFRASYRMPGVGAPSVIYEGQDWPFACTMLADEISRTGETDAGDRALAGTQQDELCRIAAAGYLRFEHAHGRSKTYTNGDIAHTIEVVDTAQ